MHILIVPSELFVTKQNPLAGIFQLEQAKALSNAGHTVGVLSVGFITLRYLFRPYPLIQREDLFGVHVYRYYLRSYSFQRFTSPHRSLELLSQIFFRLYLEYVSLHGKPDVIHAHNFIFGGLLANELSKHASIPFLITEHSSTFGRNLLASSAFPLIRSVSHSANLLSCVSHHLRQELHSYISGDIHILPNIVDSVFLEKPFGQEQSERFSFINVASLDDNKNQVLLLKSFATEFRGLDNVCLQLVGTGPNKCHLQRLSRKLGISTQVIFHGQISKNLVRDHMHNSHCFVLSSNYETFGVVLIEALASGLPIVATSCGGPQEIVDESNGILVKPNCISSLSAGMRYMYINHVKYSRARLRADALKTYGPMAFVKNAESLYSQTLSSTP